MPLPHASIAVFHEQLGRQLSVGLTLAQSLRAPSPAPAADTFALAARAEAGESAAAIFAAAGPWLPAEDRPFLAAGARAGRLPAVLAHLAARHRRLAETRRRAFLASLYPLGVFHFAALVFALVRLIDFERGFSGGFGAFALNVSEVLIPVWALAAFVVWSVRRRLPFMLAVLDRLPAIGAYRKTQARADLAFALGLLLESGVSVSEAWRVAGDLTDSPRLARAAAGLAEVAECGRPPGPELAATGLFPSAFVQLYLTGETAGNLEGALLSVAAEEQAAAERALGRATIIYPGLLFACVIGMVAYIVLSFALRYVEMINKALSG